jgi:DNA-binding MarR family transcriptional regulator
VKNIAPAQVELNAVGRLLGAVNKPELSLRQLRILVEVAAGAISQAELARRIRLSPSRVCIMISQMEAEGLVRRTPDSWDRRRVRVSLKAPGNAYLCRLLLAAKGNLDG